MNQPGYWLQVPAAEWQALLRHLQLTDQQLQSVMMQASVMQQQLDQFKQQLDELKKVTPVHVEYHFDQLKVSRLDGTLNIGLSPQVTPDIDSFEMPAPGMWTAPADPATERIRLLQQAAIADVESNGNSELLRLAEEQSKRLDTEQMQAVVNDVRAQLGGRVHYYARTAPYPEAGTDEERSSWSRTVLEKTKRDVLAAFNNYLNKQVQSSPGSEAERHG